MMLLDPGMERVIGGAARNHGLPFPFGPDRGAQHAQPHRPIR